ESHRGRPKVAIPLLQHNPRFRKAGINERGADGAHTRRRHAQIGINERQDAGAVIEGAGDDRRQVMLRCDSTQSRAKVGHFARAEENLPFGATGEFHVMLAWLKSWAGARTAWCPAPRSVRELAPPYVTKSTKWRGMVAEIRDSSHSG